MKIRLLILSIFAATLTLSVAASCPMPESIVQILHTATVKPIDTDSINRYIRQDPTAGQESARKAVYASLLECKFENTEVLIYMAVYDWYIDIYACINPYTLRYPPTLLLGRFNESSGVKNWFEIKDGKICTYALCDYWELVYVAVEEYVIENNKFILKSSFENPIIKNIDNNDKINVEYEELYNLIQHLNSYSYEFLTLRDILLLKLK